MADSLGNNVDLVGLPVTGAIALAPYGTMGPDRAEGADPEYKLPSTFTRVGLVTSDGGPEFTEERDGDPIQFWQDGYSIPTGLANCTVTFTAAETSRLVQELHAGKEPDEYGYVEVNAGGHTNRYSLWIEEIFRNGMIRRRIAYLVTVESFQAVKSERGTVMGYTIVLRIGVAPELNNNHYGQWVINPGGAAGPSILTINPATAAAGADVVLAGSGFTGVTSVRFGSTDNSEDFTVDSDSQITATIPAGTPPGIVAVRAVAGLVASPPLNITVSA